MKLLTHTIGHRDERGEIFDLPFIGDISAINYITFSNSSIRGNHYHKKTIQWNYLIEGKLTVAIRNKQNETHNLIINAGQLLLIEENESHAFKAEEFSRMMVFTMGPRAGKEYESDTYRLTEPLIK